MTDSIVEQPLPTPDLARLRKAVDWVDEQAAKPRGSEWYQARWRTRLYTDSPNTCGTAYCLAGHVVEEAGADWLSDDYLAATPEEEDTTGERWGRTPAVFVADRARRLLGITEQEGSNLFGALNTPERIRNAAEAIALRVGETL